MRNRCLKVLFNNIRTRNQKATLPALFCISVACVKFSSPAILVFYKLASVVSDIQAVSLSLCGDTIPHLKGKQKKKSVLLLKV